MPATRSELSPPPGAALYVAFELGSVEWKLAFGVGRAQPPRLKSIRARDLDAAIREIAAAKAKFGLPPDAPVRQLLRSRPRRLLAAPRGSRTVCVSNVIVDSASIEVNRRSRPGQERQPQMRPSCWRCFCGTTTTSDGFGPWCGCRAWSRRTAGTCTASWSN